MSQSLRSHVKPAPGFPIPLLPGRNVYTDPLHLCEFVLDSTAFDFHLDASPDFPLADLRDVLHLLSALGLEAIPEDECEAELLDNGRTRIYFTPTHPCNDDALIPMQQGEVSA